MIKKQKAEEGGSLHLAPVGSAMALLFVTNIGIFVTNRKTSKIFNPK